MKNYKAPYILPLAATEALAEHVNKKRYKTDEY